MAMPADRGWLRPAIIIVGTITLLRWVLLGYDRTDLYVDEAQYWLWGQDFAFGYYSKPPLIAWLIGAVTGLAGSDAVFWVRMPGALLHAMTAMILAALAVRMFSARVAVLVAAGYVTLPMSALGSLLISTDTVMAPFFAAALYFHRRLIEADTARMAMLTGAAVGMAFMAKYVAVYFLLGVALAALFDRDLRISWRNAGLMLLAFCVIVAPNIGWNLSHQMATLSHTVDNVGWVRNDNLLGGVNLSSLVTFFVSQFAVFGPVLFAVLLWGWWQNAGLASFVFPVLAVVCLQSFLGTAQANWAVAAYFAGTVLVMCQLENKVRLLTASFVINGAVCIMLPVLVMFPQLSMDGKTSLLARQLGRAAVSEQLIDIARKSGDVPIVSNNRDVLADLFYTGRASGIAFYALRPIGRAANHYEQSYPMPKVLSGTMVYVSTAVPMCATPRVAVSLQTDGGAYQGQGLKAYLMDVGCFNAE